MNKLWVVMPVYNEEECIPHVLDEWLPVLRNTVKDFTLCVLNDGSKDRTLSMITKYADLNPEIRVIDKPNSGHGQTCVYGYQIAIQEGANWILQIDSDGQCDARFFSSFWDEREKSAVTYGFRNKRGDGFKRFLFSRVVSLATFISTGIWVRDANVPYRLMRSDTLSSIIQMIPKDFHLANILVAALQQNYFGIRWKNIYFRQRIGGVPSVKAYTFGKHGIKLMRQLRAAFNNYREAVGAPVPKLNFKNPLR